MKTRRLGRTDLQVSEIGLGTWALGSSVYGDVEQAASEALIQGSIDTGINFFDTAPLYGSKTEDGVAETVLGAGLGSRKDDVVISTKFGRTATDVMPGRFTAKEARQSCEASLRRLGRDWIDLLFFHSPFGPSEIDDGVWAELEALQSEGKVRSLGHSVSMYEDTCEMSAEWMRERKIDAIQVVLSPFNRETRPLIDAAIRTDCGVVARECMANGFLSGAITRNTVFPQGSLNARYSREEVAERVDYAETLKEVMLDGAVKTLPEATYRWVLDQPGVSLALSGAKSLAEMEDPIRASQLPPFSASLLERCEDLHRQDFCPA